MPLKQPLAIAVESVSKIYESDTQRVVALDDISLSIPKGSFFGLLGANGAGKSTLINIIAQTVNKTSGHICVAGYDIETHSRKAKRSIGVVPQEIIFDPFFSVKENLHNIAGFFGIPKKERDIDAIMRALGLLDKALTRPRNLSGGMRRRLLIAKALVHQPSVLVLDEPTAGVDIELRDQLWVYIKALNRQGTTILLTTHYLEEAEQLCDEVAIMHKGRVVKQDSVEGLRRVIDTKKLIITPVKPLKEIPSTLVHYRCALEEGRLHIHYKSSNPISEILSALNQAKVEIKDMGTRDVSLTDVFRHFTQL